MQSRSRGVLPLAASALASVAFAQEAGRPTEQQLGEIESVRTQALWKLEKHNSAVNSRHRLKNVLRFENISDEEVRELVQLTRKLAPGAIVNVSGVTRGCPCEDGPACTDSVAVVAVFEGKSPTRLPFRRVRDHWVLAADTQWYWDLKQMLARRHEFPSTAAYGEAWDTLLERFPYCQEPAATPTRHAP
jgi:hypothetical protein